MGTAKTVRTVEGTVSIPAGLDAEQVPVLHEDRPWATQRRRREGTLIALAADVVAIVVAQCAALALTASQFTDQRYEMGRLTLGVLWVSALSIVLLAAYGLYGGHKVRISTARFEMGLKDVFHPIVISGFATLLLGVPLSQSFGPGLFEPTTVAAAVGLSLLLVPVARISLRSAPMAGLLRPERTLIVGSGVVASLIHEKLSQHRGYGLELVGYLDDDPHELAGCDHLGSRAQLAEACENLDIDRVVIAYSRATHEEMLGLVRSVRNPRIQISIVPRYFEVFPAHATLDDLAGYPDDHAASGAARPTGAPAEAWLRHRGGGGSPSPARAGAGGDRRRNPRR